MKYLLLLIYLTSGLSATIPQSNIQPEYRFKDPVKSLFSGEVFFQSEDIYHAFMRERSFHPDKKLKHQYNPVAPLWLPYLETLGANLALGSYNQYLMNEEFAQIDFDTIKTNFERGWHWDTDGLYTNMFLHPFQGAIYYNTARSNGYGYAASLLVTLFGSVQWEYFMENQPPSINDLVMTTFAGALFGEVFYRFSSLLLDDRDTGGIRLAREIAWVPMNPARGFNRLISGYPFRTLPHLIYERSPFILDLSLGVNNVARGFDFRGGDPYTYPFSRFQFVYGNIFRQSTYKPMDYFSMISEVEYSRSFSLKDRLRRLQIDGILYGKQHHHQKHNLIYGLYQYADYLKNIIYQIGGYSLAGGFFYSYHFSSKNIIAINLKVGWMPMGAANSDYATEHTVEYFEEEPGREYNVGTGISGRLQTIWHINDLLISSQYYFWWVHTLDGAMGDEVVGMFLPGIQYYIYKRWYISLQYLFYHRRGYYDHYKNVVLRSNEERFNIGFQF